MRKYIFITLAILFSLQLQGQNTDSLKISELSTKIEKLEGFQSITKGELENDFKSLDLDLHEKNLKNTTLLKYITIGLGVLGISTIFSLFGIWWKGKKYINDQLKLKFESIINDKRTDIIQIVNQQSQEIQFIENKKILVISATPENERFFRDFFYKLDFKVENIDYLDIKNNNEQLSTKKYDLIVANNEIGDLTKDIIDAYFLDSTDETVLFYFNSTRIPYATDDNTILNRLSFANAKTQIYGNLINLFKYQKTLK